jgi:hypothetical protein
VIRLSTQRISGEAAIDTMNAIKVAGMSPKDGMLSGMPTYSRLAPRIITAKQTIATVM